MADTNLPAVQALIKAHEDPTRPRDRVFVVAWHTGPVSVGSPGQWQQYPGWWAAGKPDQEPFKRRAKQERKPLYQVKQVVELLRGWGWEEYRICTASEFHQPLAEIGFPNEEAYLEWLFYQTPSVNGVQYTPLWPVREDCFGA
jgi:hypothetical protein